MRISLFSHLHISHSNKFVSPPFGVKYTVSRSLEKSHKPDIKVNKFQLHECCYPSKTAVVYLLVVSTKKWDESNCPGSYNAQTRGKLFELP